MHIYTNCTSICGVNLHAESIFVGADAQKHSYCYNASQKSQVFSVLQDWFLAGYQKSRVFSVLQDCFLAGYLRLPVCAHDHQASKSPEKFLGLEPTRKKDDQASKTIAYGNEVFVCKTIDTVSILNGSYTKTTNWGMYVSVY